MSEVTLARRALCVDPATYEGCLTSPDSWEAGILNDMRDLSLNELGDSAGLLQTAMPMPDFKHSRKKSSVGGLD